MAKAASKKSAINKDKSGQKASRLDQADPIVNKYVKIAAGAGLVPLPVWDVAAVFGTHLAMVKDLADLYETPFAKARARHLVGALIGGVGAPLLGHGILGSLVKSIPGIGTVGGLLTVPALAAASAYATGKVFVKHFESGGSFSTFEPEDMKTFYREQLIHGKDAVVGVIDELKPSRNGGEKVKKK